VGEQPSFSGERIIQALRSIFLIFAIQHELPHGLWQQHHPTFQSGRGPDRSQAVGRTGMLGGQLQYLFFSFGVSHKITVHSDIFAF